MLKIKRTLPGHALRDGKKNIVYHRGHVIYSSVRVQYVETDSKPHPLVYLIGDTYAYYCKNPSCGAMVYEQEVMKMGARKCPFCSAPIEQLQRGQKVRLHFRFASDGSWANWWAERWDW